VQANGGIQLEMANLQSLMDTGPIAINLGLLEFAKSLQDQNKNVIHVDWSPPPPIDEEMQDILDKLL
jgi:hypothetical protein